MRAPREPFRIKTIEHIHLIPKEERREVLERSGFNLFAIPAEKVFIAAVRGGPYRPA